jgi:hypothetical protein
MASTCEAREVREGYEWLDSEQAREAYMEELGRCYPKGVTEEQRLYAFYAACGDASGSSSSSRTSSNRREAGGSSLALAHLSCLEMPTILLLALACLPLLEAPPGILPHP